MHLSLLDKSSRVSAGDLRNRNRHPFFSQMSDLSGLSSSKVAELQDKVSTLSDEKLLLEKENGDLQERQLEARAM